MDQPARRDAYRFARSLVGRRARRAALVLVRLLQVFSVIFAFQLSGLPHRLADLAFHDDCGDGCDHGPMRGDDDDGDCPPGCPSCHSCSHVQAPYVPRAVLAPLSPPLMLVRHVRAGDATPPQRDLPAIFRPPRLDRSVV